MSKALDIFLIPSWFPTPSNPNAGIFCWEQASAYHQIFPDDRIWISYWGQEEFHLGLKSFSNWPLLGVKYLFSKGCELESEGNLRIIENRTLSWSHKYSGLSLVIKANKENFKKAMSEGNIDVIHAHVGFPGGYIASILSEEFKVPYVITEHMSPFPFEHLKKNGQLIYELNKGMKGAKKVICVGDQLESQVASYGVESTVVVPNLIDENLFSIREVKKDNIFRFVTVGNMVEQKGIDILLKAIANLKHKLSNVRFDIIGSGKLLEVYQELSKELGIENKVFFLGRLGREKLCSHLQESDAFILTSRHESFGLVYVEAMACGLPVIATKCGGPESYVNHKNGLLVEKDSIEEISEAILKIVNKEKTFNSFEVRKSVLDRFSREAVCQKIREHYLEVRDTP